MISFYDISMLQPKPEFKSKQKVRFGLLEEGLVVNTYSCVHGGGDTPGLIYILTLLQPYPYTIHRKVPDSFVYGHFASFMLR